jgi:predicted GNAT family acetyltransferase
MSLYSEYLLERTTDKIIELEYGFVTYRYLNEKQVYIVDIYIKPDSRKSGRASMLADQVVKEAKEKGCTELIGTVNPSCAGSKESLKVLFAYGMDLLSSQNNIILCKKDI